MLRIACIARNDVAHTVASGIGCIPASLLRIIVGNKGDADALQVGVDFHHSFQYVVKSVGTVEMFLQVAHIINSSQTDVGHDFANLLAGSDTESAMAHHRLGVEHCP